MNRILGRAHEDVALLRRELVDYGFLERENGTYWMAESFTQTDERVSQEVTITAMNRLRSRARS